MDRRDEINTFGQAYVEGSAAAAQFPLYDVRKVFEQRQRFRRETIRNLDRANSIECHAGRKASTGWLLMARSDYDQLNKYSTTLQLHVSDTSKSTNVGPMNCLAIVQAQCVTRGLASNPNALYLVEITDRRGLLSNKWFDFPTESMYNIRAPAYPQTFHPDSMDSGSTWTWATMLQDLWEQMGDLLGNWPGLPVSPTGTPEGFWFIGVPAWDALNNVLDHLGMQIACNLTAPAASQFTVILKGATDTALAALKNTYATNLEEDLEWIDVGAGRVPKDVTVYFKRRNSIYGSEETVRLGPRQWRMDTVYAVTIDTAFTTAAGSHYIWSDFTVRYDQDSEPLSEDVSMAESIAQERVARYLDRINPNSQMAQVYAGALPFTTGSEVDRVHWYQDATNVHRAWKTKIVHEPDPYIAGLKFNE